jgi:ribonuclease P protein component
LTHHHTLSKTERLKSYKRIRILFAQGQKFKVFPVVVYFLLRVEKVDGVEGILQMGVSVGKRHFKRAVDRNLLKRRIREAYRKQKHELKEFLIASGISMDVFFVYSNARISEYAEIESAMTQGLTILIDKLKTQTSKKSDITSTP